MKLVRPSTRIRSATRYPSVWVTVCLLVLASGWAGPLSAQQAAAPRSGLLAPFYWTEPARPVPEYTPQASTSGDEVFRPFRATNPPRALQAVSPEVADTPPRQRLLAPFYWQNPPRDETGRFEQLPAEWRPPYEGVQVQFDGQSPPAATPPSPAPDDPFLRLMQGEQITTPPGALDASTAPPIEELAAPAPEQGSANAGEGDKTLTDAESLGEEPEDTSLQFLRADTVLLEPGEMQFDIGVTYQLIEDSFTAVDGSSLLVEAELKQRLLVVPLEIRYGLTRRAQMFIGAPIGWSHTDLSTPSLQLDEGDGGLGDITAGLSFLIFDTPDRESDTVLTVAATLPTGDDPFTGVALASTAPSLGDGFFAVSADILRITAHDPVVVFYGVGFRHSLEREFLGVDIRPGTEYRGLVGLGFAVNKNITLSTRFNASFVERTELDGVAVAGSALEPFTIRFAATVLKKNKLVEPFVDIGTTDDAAASRFGVTCTY